MAAQGQKLHEEAAQAVAGRLHPLQHSAFAQAEAADSPPRSKRRSSAHSAAVREPAEEPRQVR